MISHLAMLAWPIFLIALFVVFPTRRAVIAGCVLGVLFLPHVMYKVGGLPDYNKLTCISFWLLACAVAFDWRRIIEFKPMVWDIPVVIWSLVPIASSMSNELGFYDGVSASVYQAAIWGVPYFIGRLYIVTLDDMKELAIGVVVGGLIYIPFCLYEVRMSPNLHNMIYGSHQHSFGQTRRGGGWRPMVFMTHGIMLGMWMTAATMTAFWLWRSGAVRKVAGIPISVAFFALLVTAILCKSTGALLFMIAGLGAWVLFSKSEKPAFIIAMALLLFVPFYMTVRGPDVWDGGELVEFSSTHFGPQRAGSLQTRLDNETSIFGKAMEQPLLGWAGWGRYFVDHNTIPDGMWTIAVGKNGLVGLTSWTLFMLLPSALMLAGFPARNWTHHMAAPAGVLALFLLITAIDNLFNAHPNHVFFMIGGGLTNLGAAAVASHRTGPTFAQVLVWRYLGPIFRQRARKEKYQ